MKTVERAEKALIKAMGEKPARLHLGSIEITGSSVSWEESCRSSSKRGGGRCLHARYALAPREALDSYFEALAGDTA